MKMTLPNKLTIARVIIIPIFMAVLYWGFPGSNWVALALFIIASLTDLLDGRIARKRNLVSNFGKFADPLADKMLVTSAMLWFVEQGRMPAWAVLIVIVREFAVSGLRMVAADKGKVIAAAWSGKIKTTCTMIGLCVMLGLDLGALVDWFIVGVIVATTLYSGAEYFIKNGAVLKDD